MSFSTTTARSGSRTSTFASFRRNHHERLRVDLLEIAERRLTGVYHAVCPESSTRYEFARKIAEVFGYDSALIKRTTMDQSDMIACRAKTLVLDVTATVRTLNTPLLGFEEGIRELKERMK